MSIIMGLERTLASLEKAVNNGELTPAQALEILSNILKNAKTSTDIKKIDDSITKIKKLIPVISVTVIPVTTTTDMSISGLAGTLRTLELAVKNGELTKAQALEILKKLLANAKTSTDIVDIKRSMDIINNLPPVITLECTVDKDCKTGYVCRKNKCVLKEEAECSVDRDCPKDYICIGGKCTKKSVVIVTPECYVDTDCPKGYYCDGDGYCIKLPDFTTKPCSSDAECADGYTCKDGVCVPISQVYAGCLLAFSFNALFLLTGVDLNSILPWIRTNVRAYLPRWFVKAYYRTSEIILA